VLLPPSRSSLSSSSPLLLSLLFLHLLLHRSLSLPSFSGRGRRAREGARAGWGGSSRWPAGAGG
jgi:hypothetical protein